jgi:hypothetical protein
MHAYVVYSISIFYINFICTKIWNLCVCSCNMEGEKTKCGNNFMALRVIALQLDFKIECLSYKSYMRSIWNSREFLFFIRPRVKKCSFCGSCVFWGPRAIGRDNTKCPYEIKLAYGFWYFKVNQKMGTWPSSYKATPKTPGVGVGV